jgi:hypothetical protein
MAWYNGLLNAAASGNLANSLQQASSTGTSAYPPAGTISISTGTSNAIWQGHSTAATYDPSAIITAYAKAIGWTVEHFFLPDGVTSNDPKIAVLKLANINEVIKDVGVRTATQHYFIMRDPNQSE